MASLNKKTEKVNGFFPNVNQKEKSFERNLIGKTLVEVRGGQKGSGEIIFVCSNGEKFRLYHGQDCCESVSIDDVCGDWADLIGQPLFKVEEATSRDNPPDYKTGDYQDSFTWTFYRLTSQRGQVVVRWYGESNGYYSESVDFEKVN